MLTQLGSPLAFRKGGNCAPRQLSRPAACFRLASSSGTWTPEEFGLSSRLALAIAPSGIPRGTVCHTKGPVRLGLDTSIRSYINKTTWHWREVRSRSESNLRQTSVLQAVIPDVRRPVYRPAEQHGFPRFGPHDVKRFPGHPTQMNLLMAGHVYSVKTETR